MAKLGLDAWTSTAIRLLSTGVLDETIPLGRSSDRDHLVDALVGVVGMRRETADYIAMRLGHLPSPPGRHFLDVDDRRFRAVS